MYPMHVLQVLMRSAWQDLDRAATPERVRRMRKHMHELAGSPDRPEASEAYRIICPSPYLDGAPTVVEEVGRHAVGA